MINKKDLPKVLDRNNIIAFWKITEPNRIFSNWYPIAVGDFKTAEHALMYKKAELFKDWDIANKIKQCNSSKEAKALGRLVKNFDSVIWDQNKERIMIEILKIKFSTHDTLKSILLGTGDKILVEASPVDNIWGAGVAADDDLLCFPDKWPGQNLLGFCLMHIRDLLREENK